MSAGSDEKLRVEALTSDHDRFRFKGGVDDRDRCARTQAGQDARKNIAAPIVLLLLDGSVAGYYMLSSTGVHLGELPAETARKLPRYSLVPATLLGRLAVDRRQQNKGYGRFLLPDALHRAARREIASFAVVVDARDEGARRFYERESLLALPDQPHEAISADN